MDVTSLTTIEKKNKLKINIIIIWFCDKIFEFFSIIFKRNKNIIYFNVKNASQFDAGSIDKKTLCFYFYIGYSQHGKLIFMVLH